MNNLNGFGIGIDLGGSKIEVILCKDNPLNIIHRQREACEKAQGYHGLLTQIQHLVKQCLSIVKEPIKTIGMGLPGSINPQTGLARNCNITFINGKPLQQDLQNLLQLPITVQNDANCFTLSEAILGAAKGHTHVLGVIIGTGLGGGMISHQHIHTGKNGYAAELGHTSIDYNGISCWCGNKGCVENYLSGTGLERIYRQYNKHEDDIKAPEIYQRYLQEEPHALATFKDYFIYFGRGFANFIYTFDPDIIVLGGGVSQIPLLYTEGKKAITQHFNQEHINIDIVQNHLGDSSGIYGALLMAIK